METNEPIPYDIEADKARIAAIQAELGTLSVILSEASQKWESLIYERLECSFRVRKVEG